MKFPVVALRELGSGRTWMLPDTYRRFSLGRSSRCEVRIPRIGVEREHCELSYTEDGRLRLVDLSERGFSVGKRFVSKASVGPGDVIEVGGIVLLAMSNLMLGAAATFARYLGLQRHADIDAALLAGLVESTVVIVDATGQSAPSVASALGRTRTGHAYVEWAHPDYPPRLDGHQLSHVLVRLDKPVEHTFDLRRVRSAVARGKVRLFVAVRNLDDLSRIGRYPAGLPIVNVPGLDERRADILPLFEQALQMTDRAITLGDIGARNIDALSRYSWPEGPDEIGRAARRIAAIIAGGTIDKAREADVGSRELRAWVDQLGLSFDSHHGSPALPRPTMA